MESGSCAFGPSLADDDHSVLMRAYSSVEERTAQTSRFYGSQEWATEHAPFADPLLETYHTLLLEVDESVIEALGGPSAPA